MEIALMFVVVVVILILVVRIEKSRTERRQSAWTESAEAIGLTFDGERIYGTLDGIEVTVDHVVRGGGRNREEFTVFNASLAGNSSVPEDLNIVSESIAFKLGKAVGMQDIDLGLPGLDKKLMVRGPNPEQVREWAQRSDIARGLEELTKLPVRRFQLTDIVLTFESNGVVLDPIEMDHRLRQLARLARCFAGQGIGALASDGHW